MKRFGSVFWGIILIALGSIFALNALEITHIDIFFDGWWTLFIIVPCVIGFFREGDKVGNLVGVGIGVILLLACQGILEFSMLWKLIVPTVIIIIGLKLVFGGMFRKKASDVKINLRSSGKKPHSSFSAFCGNRVDFEGQSFYGAELNAVFGGLDYYLCDAIIPQDCVIEANAIFGGIDIFLPEDVNVEVNSNAIFGGVDNKRGNCRDHAVTVYIQANAIFGGVEIK